MQQRESTTGGTLFQPCPLAWPLRHTRRSSPSHSGTAQCPDSRRVQVHLGPTGTERSSIVGAMPRVPLSSQRSSLLFILDQRVRRGMVRRPKPKRATSPRPECKKIGPKTHPQKTAAEEIGNRVLAFEPRWRARSYIALDPVSPGFKNGLSCRFDFSNCRLSLCRFLARKLTHIQPLEPLRLSGCRMRLLRRKMLSSGVISQTIEFRFIHQNCRSILSHQLYFSTHGFSRIGNRKTLYFQRCLPR